MSACPCGLTKAEVKDFDSRAGVERVALIRGICQNLPADGSHGVCGRPLGAHPFTQVATLVDEFQSVKFVLKDVKDNMPSETFVITPSEGCKSTKETKYRRLMESLRLPAKGNLLKMARKFQPLKTNGKKSAITKIFNWKDCVLESDCYPFVCEYLRNQFKLNAVDIGSGQDLMDGNLFDVDIYSMRRAFRSVESIANNTYTEPVLKYRLLGKSDIAVLKAGSLETACWNLDFIIEIKPPKLFKTAEEINLGLREGLLQLIGTNSSNIFSSPPVIVTDLEKQNFVLYLTMENKSIPHYCLNIMSVDSFDEVIHYVQSTISGRVPITSHFTSFSRRNSPKASPAKFIEDEDDDDDDEDDNLGMDLNKIRLFDKTVGEENFHDDQSDVSNL
eukprot:gene17428-24097_t